MLERFRWILVALAAALPAACASSPRVYRYESLGFSVVKADPVTVDRVCRARVKLNDRGEPISRRIRCCYLSDRSIWVAHTDVDCILHELCHADGRKRSDCERVY